MYIDDNIFIFYENKCLSDSISDLDALEMDIWNLFVIESEVRYVNAFYVKK